MADVTRNIIVTGVNSGVIRDGDVVFLTANTMGLYTVKHPNVNGVGPVTPSGTYGAVDDGYLSIRFKHPDILIV